MYSPRFLLSLALLVTSAGCGGMQFEREAGVPRYKALPYNQPIAVLPTLADVPQPNQVLGTFATTTKDDDRSSVETQFKKNAARYGCDAVADVQAQVDEKKSMRTVKVPGAHGKTESRQEEVITRIWNWTGRCVRTVAVGLDPDKEPVNPEVVTVPSPGVAERDEGPGGAAASPAVREMCERMDRYSEGWLKTWKDKLRAPKPEAMDVLEAWSELMLQVSGPGGFWKKTVPTLWYGCAEDAGSAQCARLQAGSREFAKWDQVQAQIASLPRAQAGGWLKRNQKRLTEYMDTYVPDEPSLSAMQATGFYKAHLAL